MNEIQANVCRDVVAIGKSDCASRLFEPEVAIRRDVSEQVDGDVTLGSDESTLPGVRSTAPSLASKSIAMFDVRLVGTASGDPEKSITYVSGSVPGELLVTSLIRTLKSEDETSMLSSPTAEKLPSRLNPTGS